LRNSRKERKERKTMNETLVQAVIWLAAGGIMILFLKRRRGRRVSR
jgi:hypothetical protein